MSAPQQVTEDQPTSWYDYDAALSALDAAKHDWARTGVDERIKMLDETGKRIMSVAQTWADRSARAKRLKPGTPVAGEEWLAGPYATLVGVNALKSTLTELGDKSFIDSVSTRVLSTEQLAVEVVPRTIWDRLLLSGVSAEVWMQPGVTSANLSEHAAIAYDIPVEERVGKVALILGAGNIAAIPPMDVLQKLLVENHVAILKMNPLNDYLTDLFREALKPFIDADALRIVTGGAEAGAYLSTHSLVDELHITGSAATHDTIVWGVGEEESKNRAAGTPKNSRRFTSELGAVSPTIVVPGPWTKADLRFQAENIATMKLHNAGHNCIACQVLVMAAGWSKSTQLIEQVKSTAEASTRPSWYPGASERLDRYIAHGGSVETVNRGPDTLPLVIGEVADDGHNLASEVFGPAMGIKWLNEPDPERFLQAAIDFANDDLWGSLGANILIHPRTLNKIGQSRFDEIVADLRYGTVGINVWCGMAFLLANCPWGAYPGHTAENIQSGVGTVHNALMLENTEKVVLRAPWRPFPRGLLSGQLSLLPRPPYFITNRAQHRLGPLLTEFEHEPSWFKLPRIFLAALRG